eukprot:TRINITY_DN41646_c0_g1_i1.p1 TRINITY_DN41646_c0_g1~~TRINITY_DN41646_c0_g1_i1.p1  ORF type:complete len:317 (-),score=102.77 TRINITY_DN41646_c0_g1_i1:46-996(-)
MSEGAAGWHCVVIERFTVGSGAQQHTKFRAQSSADGGAPQELVFRFSEVDKLLGRLAQLPDLRDVTLPPLPPKATFRSMLGGRFDEAFLEERQCLLTQFFEELGALLSAKYAVVGNAVELCEPLGEFVQHAAQLASTEEREAVAQVAAAIRREEDREIIATQNEEYEESLRQDELRSIAEAEKAEAERQAKLEEERRAETAAAEAAALLEDIKARRARFEVEHPLPQAGEPQATVRFRAASGATVQRAFADSSLVSALFEFAAVADWDGPAPGRSFDLRTSFPVQELRGVESQTLRQAGLCPSAVLLVAEHEDASP